VSTATEALAGVQPASGTRGSVVVVVRHPSVGSTASSAAAGSTTTKTTTTTTSPTPASPGGSGSSPAPAPTSGSGSGPAAPAPLSQAQIQQRYVQGCASAAGAASPLPYCTCMYDHLRLGGAFTSPASITALAREIREFERTQDIYKLPAFVRAALTTCASRLPTPKLTITKLPRLHDPSVPPPAGSSDPQSLKPNAPGR